MNQNQNEQKELTLSLQAFRGQGLQVPITVQDFVLNINATW